MNKINRKPKPECLVENAQKWTKDLIEKRKTKPDYWYWQIYKKEKVEHLLTPILSEMTNNHCSYCGLFSLEKNVGGGSIDHFKPKSTFPELAFEWTNLFIACPECQKLKGSDFPKRNLIKFDDIEYDFENWFDIEWKTGKIIANPDKTEKEQSIAQTTIDWLGINKGSRPKARNDELEKYNGNSITDIWRWSYPYFLERGKICRVGKWTFTHRPLTGTHVNLSAHTALPD